MKCKRIIASAVAAVVFSCAIVRPAPAQQPSAPTAGGLELKIQVTDVKHNEGQLLFAVFNQEAGFPREVEKALAKAKALPTKPEATFKNLPPGNYAVVVIHDRNNSGDMDKNLLGMPKEPVGLSNYKTIGFSNPPNFRKALFSIQQSSVLKVKLISL